MICGLLAQQLLNVTQISAFLLSVIIILIAHKGSFVLMDHALLHSKRVKLLDIVTNGHCAQVPTNVQISNVSQRHAHAQLTAFQLGYVIMSVYQHQLIMDGAVEEAEY